MPSTRWLYQVTETDEVSLAPEISAQKWPHLPPSRLLLRLVETGAQTVESENEASAADRKAALDRVIGKYCGMYPPEYLEELLEGWPD